MAAHVTVVLVPVAAGDLVDLSQFAVLDVASAARPRESRFGAHFGEFAQRAVGDDLRLSGHGSHLHGSLGDTGISPGR